jgi:hypothetical protein
MDNAACCADLPGSGLGKAFEFKKHWIANDFWLNSDNIIYVWNYWFRKPHRAQ